MAFTRRPRGCREEAWWRGQPLAAKVLAEELIDSAAFERKTVSQGGKMFTIEPGEALFSLTELERRTGATREELRWARDSLAQVGFLSYRRAHGSTAAKTVYSITEWRRFIAAQKRTPAKATQATPQQPHSRNVDGREPDAECNSPQPHSNPTATPQQPSRSSRANVQSTEHRASDQEEEEKTEARSKSTAREVPEEWEEKWKAALPQTREEAQVRAQAAIAKIEQWCRDNGEPWAEIGPGGRNGAN